jgi:hypothetical protein
LFFHYVSNDNVRRASSREGGRENMERSLLIGALTLGCVGFLCSIAVVSGRDSRGGWNTTPVLDRGFWILAALMPFAIFFATLPSNPPIFSQGHGFGSGFAVGGLAALLSGWMLIRSIGAPRDTPLFGAGLSAGPLSASVAAVALIRLLLHDQLVIALLSAATGWFTVTMIFVAGLIARSDESRTCHAQVPLASSAGFMAVICSAAALGDYRGETVSASDTWSTAAIVMAAGVPLVVYLCSLSASLFARVGLKTPFPRLFAGITQRLFSTEDGRAAAARVWRAIVASGLLIGLAYLLSSKLLTQPSLFTISIAGALAGWVCWWLVAEGSAVRSGDSSASAPQFVPIAVLLILGVSVVAFNRLAGFGIAVALISAWLSLAMAQAFVVESANTAPDSHSAAEPAANLQGLFQLLLFGVGFLIYRVVMTRFSDDLRGVGLADHYGIAGFLTGAVAPVLMAGVVASAFASKSSRTALVIGRLVVAGLLALAIPAVAIVLWRSKVVLTLVAGLSLASVSSLWGRRDADSEVEGSADLMQSMFALGSMLAISLWTHHAVGFGALTRDAKTGLITWIAGGIVIAILALDLGGRAAARLSGSSKPASAGGTDR